METYYTLDEFGRPKHETDLDKWEAWYDSTDRSVERSVIGDAFISTVFLACRIHPQECLWETAVQGGKLNGKIDRCDGDKDQAEAMHWRMVELVRQSQASQTDDLKL